LPMFHLSPIILRNRIIISFQYSKYSPSTYDSEYLSRLSHLFITTGLSILRLINFNVCTRVVEFSIRIFATMETRIRHSSFSDAFYYYFHTCHYRMRSTEKQELSFACLSFSFSSSFWNQLHYFRSF